MARAFTHVVKFDGGEMVSQIGPRPDRQRFAAPLSRQDGVKRWALGLFPLPDDMSYDDMLSAGQEFTEYVQAGGKADALTVEIRKRVGQRCGYDWVRYVIGHPHDGDVPLDVEIPMPHGAVIVSAAEVFDAEEAADLLLSYHQSGDIPSGYVLRPVEGYKADVSRFRDWPTTLRQ
jgi:hypothetical protein